MAKKRMAAASVSIQMAKCSVLCSTETDCPLCHQRIPRNTLHECEKDGVRTVRNTPKPSTLDALREP